MRTSRKPLVLAVTLTVTLALAAAACGDDATTGGAGTADSIVVYSGRSEDLISPLLDAFTAATGVAVESRYADSAELALLIETEGDSSPADVFISQSPGALAYLAGQNRLSDLDADLLDRVDPGFRAADGTWVGLTGRVRTLVYNSDLVDEAELPESVFDLTGPEFAGRVAVAPTNGSFQDFITAMRHEIGDEATAEWLAGMAANESPNYASNSAIVEATGRGEVDMGLVNHYYNLRAVEADPSVTSVNHFFPSDDLGALVIVTGGAVLASSDAAATGAELLAFLLSPDSQAEFVAETQEYGLIAGMDPPGGLPPLSAFTVDAIDYEILGAGLTGTQDLIRASGIER
jgi:iron(III) transport system substrate-binding protein